MQGHGTWLATSCVSLDAVLLGIPSAVPFAWQGLSAAIRDMTIVLICVLFKVDANIGICQGSRGAAVYCLFSIQASGADVGWELPQWAELMQCTIQL